MSESLYDYGTEHPLNASLDRFPASGTFGEFNDRMRSLMAAVAQFLRDSGGQAIADLDPLVVTTSFAEDGTLVVQEPVATPLPRGFLLLFRVQLTGAHPQLIAVDGNANPLWINVGGNAHPVVLPGERTPANFTFRTGSIYLAVFTGSSWQVISNPYVADGYDYASPGAAIGADRPLYTEEATGGAFTLEAAHINSTLLLTNDPANSSGALAITIPAKLHLRWPEGSWIDIVQIKHSDVTIAFDDPIQASPVWLSAVGVGGSVPAGTLVNNLVFFRLMRTSPLTITYLNYPRGVR